MTLRDLLRYRWGCSSCWLGSSHPVMCWALCTTLPSLFQGGHLPVGHLVAAGEQPHNRSVVRKLHDGVWSLCCHAVVGVEGIPEGAEDTATWHSRADGQPWRGAVATTWRQSVKNSRIQSHIVKVCILELTDEPRGQFIEHYFFSAVHSLLWFVVTH